MKAPRHRRIHRASWIPQPPARTDGVARQQPIHPSIVPASGHNRAQVPFEASPPTELPRPSVAAAGSVSVAPATPAVRSSRGRWLPLLVVGALALAAVGYGAYVDHEFKMRIRDVLTDSGEKQPFSLTGGWRQLMASKPTPTPAASNAPETSENPPVADLRTTPGPSARAPETEREAKGLRSGSGDLRAAPVAPEQAPPSKEASGPETESLHLHVALTAVAALPLPVRETMPPQTTKPGHADPAPAPIDERSTQVTHPTKTPAAPQSPPEQTAPFATKRGPVAKLETSSVAPVAARSRRPVLRRQQPSPSYFVPWPWKYSVPPTFEHLSRSAP